MLKQIVSSMLSALLFAPAALADDHGPGNQFSERATKERLKLLIENDSYKLKLGMLNYLSGIDFSKSPQDGGVSDVFVKNSLQIMMRDGALQKDISASAYSTDPKCRERNHLTQEVFSAKAADGTKLGKLKVLDL